jgi:hypothetical protein
VPSMSPLLLITSVTSADPTIDDSRSHGRPDLFGSHNRPRCEADRQCGVERLGCGAKRWGRDRGTGLSPALLLRRASARCRVVARPGGARNRRGPLVRGGAQRRSTATTQCLRVAGKHVPNAGLPFVAVAIAGATGRGCPKRSSAITPCSREGVLARAGRPVFSRSCAGGRLWDVHDDRCVGLYFGWVGRVSLVEPAGERNEREGGAWAVSDQEHERSRVRRWPARFELAGVGATSYGPPRGLRHPRPVKLGSVNVLASEFDSPTSAARPAGLWAHSPCEAPRVLGRSDRLGPARRAGPIFGPGSSGRDDR